MNCFERVSKTLKGEKPDKMPFYYPTLACSVGKELLGREVNSGSDSLWFKEELSRLGGDECHREFVESLHEDTIELYRVLNADFVRETLRSKAVPTKKIDDYTLLFQRPDNSYFVKRFFPESQSYGVIEDTSTNQNDPYDLLEHLEAEAAVMKSRTVSEMDEYYSDALKFKSKADPYFPSMINAIHLEFPMTDTRWLEALILEPETVKDYFIEKAKQMLPDIKYLKEKGYDFIGSGGDIASQTGPMFSPKTFDEVFSPALKIINDECKKQDIIYCYRTDGNIWSLFDSMFNDIGFQSFGEVDRLADMSVQKIRAVKPDLILLGNVSSATLNCGSEAQVREEVRASLVESEGYNYIAGPSNAILAGTPAKNVYAMVEEIENFKP